MVTWSYFLEVFQKSEILKNAVSGRWCLDSKFYMYLYVNTFFLLWLLVPVNNFSAMSIQNHSFPMLWRAKWALHDKAYGHYMIKVGIELGTSCSGVQCSTSSPLLPQKTSSPRATIT